MTSRAFALLAAMALVIDTSAYAQSYDKLPALKGDAGAVSVSGISAGAFMATQIQIAFSASIMGVGSIAGGPWNCSENSAFTAQTTCMSMTSQIDPSELASELQTEAQNGTVDPLDGLKRVRVYLYNSPTDGVVRPPVGKKTQAFYEQFVPAAQIKVENSIRSAHGFPTLNYGSACGTQGSPWLQNCNFDGAGAILTQIYNTRSLKSVAAVPASLHAFDQAEFGGDDIDLASYGYVYIPEKCRAGGCPVHVALHGCLQSIGEVGDAFAQHAGYNDWAEGSGLVVIYPQAVKGSGNPNACFDWWGYTGSDYATKNGAQMKAIKAMIDRVTAAL